MMQSIPARMVKCVFCGHSGRWWECTCQQVQEVRAGKRAKPRVVFRDGVPKLIVDRETVAANHLGLKATELTDAEYRKIRGLDPVSTTANIDKPLGTKETEIGPANTDEAVSRKDANKPDDGGDLLLTKGSDVDVVSNSSANKTDRRAYMRELMRRKREGGCDG